MAPRSARPAAVVALALLLADLAPAALAQATALPFKEESVGDYSAPGAVTVTGAFAGTRLVIDRAFTDKHENGPPSAPFSIIAPRGHDLRLLAGGKKSGVAELVRVTLPTSDGKQAVEILRFANLYIPRAPAAVRLNETAALLRNKAAPMVSAGYEAVTLLDLYATKVGGHDAVSMHLQMAKPGSGEVYFVKAIAILHPELDGVMAFLMANGRLSEIKAADDLRAKGIGLKIIHSLKFLDAAGR